MIGMPKESLDEWKRDNRFLTFNINPKKCKRINMDKHF